MCTTNFFLCETQKIPDKLCAADQTIQNTRNYKALVFLKDGRLFSPNSLHGDKYYWKCSTA